MAGNIFSRAMMSIFMDKKARQKYDAIQASKKSARGKKKNAKAAQAASPASDDDILPETLIQHAIGEAEAELDRKKRLPPDRQALIEQALAVHDQQSKVLDDLPKEQREKLAVMALHAFGELADDGSYKDPAKAKRKKRRD